MNRLITARADRVTAQEFMRRVFGPDPADVVAAMSDDELEREYRLALKRKDRMLPWLVGEKFRRVIEGDTQFTETVGDPLLAKNRRAR